MKAVIITEGSRKLGYGHINRCRAIYDAFEEQNVATALIVNGDDEAHNLLGKRKHIIMDWNNERERIFKNLKDVDIAIIDSYLTDIDFYINISDIAQIPAYIDDNNRMEYPTGVIINGTFYGEKVAYNKRTNIKYILGSKYIPVRKEFWDIEDREISMRLKTVLISFGADDPNNLTPMILNILSERYPGLVKIAVIGNDIENMKLANAIADTNTIIINYSDTDVCMNAFLTADIGITSSGQSLFEMARVGLPTIAVGVADNALDNIIGWRKPDFLNYAGWWDKPDMSDQVLNSIKLMESMKVRQEKSRNGKEIVDGQGCRRIVQTLIEMV